MIFLSSSIIHYNLIYLLINSVLESSGSVDVVVRTWRPQGDLKSKMRELFLGTSVRLKDSSFAHVHEIDHIIYHIIYIHITPYYTIYIIYLVIYLISYLIIYLIIYLTIYSSSNPFTCVLSWLIIFFTFIYMLIHSHFYV